MEENMINESDMNTILLYEELKSVYTFNKVEFIENGNYIIGYF